MVGLIRCATSIEVDRSDFGKSYCIGKCIPEHFAVVFTTANVVRLEARHKCFANRSFALVGWNAINGSTED